MKRTAILFCVVATLGMRGGPAAEPSADPLTVRIVPTRSRDPFRNSSPSITLHRPSDHFHVVITNVSDKPVRIWSDLCSWGYFCLTFEVRDRDGRTRTVKRKTRGWDANAPDPESLAPGDHKVFDVSLQDGTWVDVPVSQEAGGQFVSMRAIYEIPVEKQATEHQVWTGRVASPPATYWIER
jgi:hypothetical protein